jgi:hypothetical protein
VPTAGDDTTAEMKADPRYWKPLRENELIRR